MNSPAITTTVYKYKPYAPWMLGVYCILLLVLFIASPGLPAVVTGISAAFLLLLPIYGAIRPKSFFSVRSVDERKLTIGTETILWDGLTIPVKEVSGLSIYLFAFEDFRHEEMGASGMRRTTTEFGDQNKLNFFFQDKEYDFTFYIGNFFQYQTVLKIIKAWQDTGCKLSARSAFDYSYIQEQNAYYARRFG